MPTTMFSTFPTFTGAATITRFAPRSTWPCSVSGARNLPVHSSTRSTPRSPQGMSPGAACDVKPSRRSPMRRASSPSAPMSARQRPCTLSNCSRCAVAAAPPLISLRCTTSRRLPARGSSCGRSAAPIAARRARRPMRPMPLIPTFIAYAFGTVTVRLFDDYRTINRQDDQAVTAGQIGGRKRDKRRIQWDCRLEASRCEGLRSADNQAVLVDVRIGRGREALDGCAAQGRRPPDCSAIERRCPPGQT